MILVQREKSSRQRRPQGVGWHSVGVSAYLTFVTFWRGRLSGGWYASVYVLIANNPVNCELDGTQQLRRCLRVLMKVCCSDFRMASTIIQIYLKQVLESFFHVQAQVRLSALEVIILILRQGLVHPIQVRHSPADILSLYCFFLSNGVLLLRLFWFVQQRCLT